ncbi:hypothetical protein GCM10009415_36390 [Chitinophaga japonensis]
MYCLLAGLLIMATAVAQPSPLLQEAAAQLERAKTTTLAMAASMPEDKYTYKPVADEMTFAAQLLHMAQNISWLASAYITDTPNPFTKADLDAKGKSKELIIATVEKAFDYAIAAVKGMDAAQLDEQVKFFAGPMSRRQIINLMNDHQVHHRGQLVVYLRLNGIQPPKYVGW